MVVKTQVAAILRIGETFASDFLFGDSGHTRLGWESRDGKAFACVGASGLVMFVCLSLVAECIAVR